MIFKIENFKSIHKVSLDLDKLTILAGTNSSGKSSFIQAMLLLKQTLLKGSSEILRLNGPYLYVNSPIDILHNKKDNARLSFEISLSKNDFLNSSDFFKALDAIPLSLNLKVIFKVDKEGFYVYRFELKSEVSKKESTQKEYLKIEKIIKKDVYTIELNSHKYSDVKMDRYSFYNFFPVFAKTNEGPVDFPISIAAKETISDFFNRIFYIGPARVSPVLSRSYDIEVKSDIVEADGENTRFVLNKLADSDSDILKEIKFWICDKLKLCKDFQVIKESQRRFRFIITSSTGLKIDLNHVGFGVSQVIPIITQGLITPQGSLLIVEDPEAHMHPAVQASLADFFIQLFENNKVFSLIETHSDHFITRIRRRIAEKEISSKDVHLIFAENEFGESLYQSVNLSPEGRMEGHMPKGFMDILDTDFRAIIAANMMK